MKFIGIPRKEQDKGEKIRSVFGGLLLFTFVFLCVIGAESFLSGPRTGTSPDESALFVSEPSATVAAELLPAKVDESLPSLPDRSSDQLTNFVNLPDASGITVADADYPVSHIPYTVYRAIADAKSGGAANAAAIPSVTPAVTPAPVTETSENVHYFVIADLSVRTGPGTEFEKTASLVLGDEVDSIAATSNGWKKLSDNTYVIDDYLSTLPPEDALDATFYVIGDANVRSGPGTDYEVVKTLKKGDAITVVAATSNGWFKTVKGTYVSKDVCTDTPPATPTPTPTPKPTPVPTKAPKPTAAPTNSQPSATKLQSGDTVRCKITFYGPQKRSDGSYSTTTASNTTCSVGTTVAADWSIFPKKSTIYIEGLPLNLYDGSFKDDGYYTVEDSGSDIKGYWIDIYVPSEEIADSLNTMYLNVTVQ